MEQQTSDEHLDMKRDQAGRGLKSMREAYKDTRVRVACYMAKSYSMAEEVVGRDQESC